MLTGKPGWLPLVFCVLCVTAYGQEMKLEPGNPVEHEIAGGESHTYRFRLTAGQFARFRLEQRAIDAALILNAPDGKQLVEMKLTRAGDEESLSLEAAVSGDYHLTVRAGGLATLRGTYRLEALGKAAATAQGQTAHCRRVVNDRSDLLSPQAGKAAPKIIENLQQTLAVWRE